MNARTRLVVFTLAIAVAVAPRLPAQTPAAEIDWKTVDAALGRTGAMQPGGVYRFGMPRSDLEITSQGVSIRPSFALGSWVAFKQSGPGQAAINGDVVMTAGEVDRVIAVLREHGIQVVALHNHLTDEEPRLFFMHYWANDAAAKLARGLRAALDQTNVQR